LYQAGADTFNAKKRAAIYRQAQQIMAQTLPMILVCLYNVTIPTTHKVTNYTWYGDHGIRFQDVV
jgi:ABC-type transport system substrate-binding protein